MSITRTYLKIHLNRQSAGCNESEYVTAYRCRINIRPLEVREICTTGEDTGERNE